MTRFSKHSSFQAFLRGFSLLALLIVFQTNTSRCWSDNIKPNFVILFADNLGYGDIGCFGSKVNRTLNLDRMASEGIKLTSFYVGSSICTPSRAAIMTGCYPARVSMEISGTRRGVLQPVAQKGLAPSEITIAEVLKQQGYATTCIGKWHLGDQPPFLPTRQGFDHYFGVPYSEDMIATTAPRVGEMWPPVPLLRDEVVVEAPVDPNTLTKRYTHEAIQFIHKHKSAPFFLYLPYAVPGSSKEAFAADEFRKKSESGVYGACIEELDWSAGEILRCLKDEGLDENTFVIWTSDNGAFQGRRVQPFGQNSPLKGTGGTPFEGGFRVPCIARWPSKIPAGSVSDELLTSMDLLPTFARLASAEVPEDRIIDGKDIWPMLTGETTESPHETFFYYARTQLRAVRSGGWKLLLPVNTNADRVGTAARFEQLQLYNLRTDRIESTNLAEKYPQKVDELSQLAESARIKLGDVGLLGSQQRPAGWVDNVQALRLPGLPSRRGFPTDATPLFVEGTGLKFWNSVGRVGWTLSSSVALDVDDAKQLVPAAIPGETVLYNTAEDPLGKQAGTYLVSRDDFGDIKAHVEFLCTEGSNSGVYLMGRYEIQIFDSYGVPESKLKHSDCGGIYQRWDAQANPKGYEGVAPLKNAARPAGEWQSLDIVFQAPRFDTEGAKIRQATFKQVSLNGVVIHENVACSGPTRAAKFSDEAPKGPLVIQGDHGPIALRNIWIRSLKETNE